MKKRTLSILLVITLVFTLTTFTAYAEPSDWNAARYGETVDIGSKLRAMENDDEGRAAIDEQIQAALDKINSDGSTAGNETEGNSNFTYNGGTKYFVALDTVYGYYLKTFTLRSLGNEVEIWVADNISYNDDRPTPVITQEQVDKMRDQFDNNIYAKDTEFFGMPDSHTGDHALLAGMFGEDYYAPIEGKERVIILVDNVRDESYHDPSYPFYVAGFFSPTLERYMDRNIITIDTNKWETRLDPGYYATVAHEFQHLIHADNDPDEETWINEGMSDFAEYLCGYGHPWGHVNFFLDHPENSLVTWDEYYNAETGPETLADYGQAYLLQLYLNDKYGKEVVRALAKDEDNGIISTNKILNQFGTGIDFNELFRRFTIAVALDSPMPGEGIYNFDSIDIKVNYQKAMENAKDGVPAWGADYIALGDTGKIQKLLFDGIDFLATPWMVVNNPTGTDQVLFGNTGDEKDNQIIFEADLTNTTAATLNFEHLYMIEEHWDFGMVQVSEDGGNTWVSLANENTSYDIVPEGHPAIAANLPGFTGTNNDWTAESFDLSAYAGKKVHIGFRYMTDWSYNDPGWYIKNIQIPEIGYFNAGNTLDGFTSIDKLLGVTVEYSVTFINEKTHGNSGKVSYKVLNIDPFNVTEQDALSLQGYLNHGNNYMIVWYAAPAGKVGVVDYNYELTANREYNKNKDKGNNGKGNGKNKK
ncbi:MAG: choice-of-anchor J domain-containing protein [Bacillota bacterium]